MVHKTALLCRAQQAERQGATRAPTHARWSLRSCCTTATCSWTLALRPTQPIATLSARPAHPCYCKVCLSAFLAACALLLLCQMLGLHQQFSTSALLSLAIKVCGGVNATLVYRRRVIKLRFCPCNFNYAWRLQSLRNTQCFSCRCACLGQAKRRCGWKV